MVRVNNVTPGPTKISENVRIALSLEVENTDLSLKFYEKYKLVTTKIQKLLNTKNDCIIMCGEAILGLEASVCSLVEKGDRVLCIGNGIYGDGFVDFVEMYEGIATHYAKPHNRKIDVTELSEFLEKDNDYKIATLVHCETPTGITNDVKEICELLKKYNIMTIVDTVSGAGGEKINGDIIDIVIGGSQKVLSAPAGLTFMSISDKAYEVMENRKMPIRSYYANLLMYKDWYEKKWFPYTMCGNLINGLDVALDNILGYDSVAKHEMIRKKVIKTLEKSGLELFAQNGYSNTVTAIKVPDKIDFETLNQDLLDQKIMIGGGIGEYDGKLFRIGHMGEQCDDKLMLKTFEALDYVMELNSIRLVHRLSDMYKLL